MEPARAPFREATEALRAELGARAAGLWRVGPEALTLLAFVAAEDIPEAVARGFADATRRIPRDRAELGVVRAATSGTVAASHAAGLPADAGSGYWLRAFGAARSVAVPLADAAGAVRAIWSVALGPAPPDDEAVADRVRERGRALAPHL